MSNSETENDFDFYLKFAKPLVLNLSKPDDRVLAAAWIQKLRDEDIGDLRLRTDYLKLLLFVLQRKKLIGTFATHPNEVEKLDDFPESNLLDVAKELLQSENEFLSQRILRGLATGAGDFPPFSTEHSADLLEYSAAQDIPNFGVHAYYAISTEPLPNWERTEKAVFPKGATSTTDRGGTPSKVSTCTSEPALKPSSGGKSRPRSKSRSRPRSPKGGPSPTLGSKPKEDEDRSPPTWGSNLIGVSEPPVRDFLSEPPSDVPERGDPYGLSKPPCSHCGSPGHSQKMATPTYSPKLPEGEVDAFFLETPPSFLEAESPPHLPCSTRIYPSQPYSPQTNLSAKAEQPYFTESEFFQEGAQPCSTRVSRSKSPHTSRQPCFSESSQRGVDPFGQKSPLPCSTRISSYQASVNQRPLSPIHEPPYSPKLPTGDADPFFLESPPSFLMADSPPPCSPVKGSSRSPQKMYSPNIQQMYSPQLPGGDVDPFFLESPPSFLDAESPPHLPCSTRIGSPIRSPLRRQLFPAAVDERDYNMAELEKLGLDRSDLGSDVFNLDNLEDFKISEESVVSDHEPSLSRQAIDDDLDAFDRMIAEFETDGDVCPVPLQKSPVPSPRQPSPPAKKQVKKVIQKKTTIKKRIPTTTENTKPPCDPCPGPSRSQQRNLKPRTIKKSITTTSSATRTVVPQTQTSRPGSSKIGIPRDSRFSALGNLRPSAPAGPYVATSRIAVPTGSRLPAPRGTQTTLPAVSRPGTSRIPAAGTSRIPAAGSSRVYAPGSSRIPAPGGSRIPAPGGTRIPTSGGLRPPTRIPSSGDSRIIGSSSKSRIPGPQSQQSGMDKPRVSRIPYQGTVHVKATSKTPPYSPILPEGEADPFFLESPPSFLDQSSLPSLGSSGYPSVFGRTPSPQRLPYRSSPGRQLDMSGTLPSAYQGTPPPTRYSSSRQADTTSSYPSVYRGTPSPRRSPVSGQEYDMDLLNELGLNADDLKTDLFNFNDLNQSNISEVTISSELEYEEAPEFNVQSKTIDDELDAWDRQIAELEEEHAEDIKLYGSQSPKVDERLGPTELQGVAAPFVIRQGSPAARDIINAANRQFKQSFTESTPSPRRSPDKSLESFEEFERMYASPPRAKRANVYSIPPGSTPQDLINIAGKARMQYDQLKTPPSLETFEEQEKEYAEDSFIADIPAYQSPLRTPPGLAAPQVAEEMARRQLEQLRRDPELEKQYEIYKKQLECRRPDVPRTPPIFSKFKSMMGDEADREYHPSEFGETSGIEWEAGEQFFEGKTSLSPRIDERELKQLFKGIERRPEDELFFEQESIPELDNVENEYENSLVTERSPAATRDDLKKRLYEVRSDLSQRRESSPAGAGLPMTTPRRSPSPKRQAVSLHLEGDDGMMSFKMPSCASPTVNLLEESPPIGFNSPHSPYESLTKSPISPTKSPLTSRPGLRRIRNISDEYKEENVPFLAQVEAATGQWPGPSRKMRIAAPGISPIRERSAKLKDTTGFRRVREALERKFADLPELSHFAPDDLLGVEGYVAQSSSPYGELDTSIPQDLPSPLRMPVEVPGWSTPPHLKIPKMQRSRFENVPQQLPELAHTVKIKPRERDILYQEIPPTEMMYSPPLLSPGSVPQFEKTPPARRDSPAAPRSRSPQSPVMTPNIFSVMPDDNLIEEAWPEDMYYSPESPAGPQAISPESPISSPESPSNLRHRLWQQGEPAYYSQDEMYVISGRPRVIKRRSAPPRLYGIRDVPDTYNEENVPFLSQLDAAKINWPHSPRRIRIAAPTVSPIRESPIRVPNVLEVDDPTGFRQTRMEMERRYADLPELPNVAPDDLFGVEGYVAPYVGPFGELDRSIPEDLPSPIRPATVVPGWSTPPHLKMQKRRRPVIVPQLAPEWSDRIQPQVRDILSQEMPPTEMMYSPPPLSPRSSPQFSKTSKQHLSPKRASPCGVCTNLPEDPNTANIFSTSPYTNLTDEALPEDLYYSPKSPAKPQPYSSESPISSPESPFSLRLRLWQEGEPAYYSQDEMCVISGRPRVIKRRSAPPRLYGIRDVPDTYNEENVPFLSQLDAAKINWPHSPRRIRIAAPQVSPIRESPMNVPNVMEVEDPTGFRRVREQLERKFADLPELPDVPPDDLFGVEGYRAPCPSPFSELDRGIPEGLPSPVRPPVVVPGWSTPPHLKTQKTKRYRPIRVPQLAPEWSENVNMHSKVRDILSQEMPPTEIMYSPPPSSPRSSPEFRPKTPEQRLPTPRDVGQRRRSPQSPVTPNILKFSSDGNLIDDVSPADLYYSPQILTTTPHSEDTHESPLSSPESPFSLRLRLWQEGEPAYYSQDEMCVVSGRPKIIKRRSAPPGLYGIRDVPDTYNEENVPFLSQLDAAKIIWPHSPRRIRVAAPRVSPIRESPMNVPNVTEVDDPTGFRRVREELERRFADLPALPQTRPNDLMGVEGQMEWNRISNELDRSPPKGLRSPIKPPTVVPGWSTPPRLKTPVKPPEPYQIKLIPGLRDILFQEAPPPEMSYSPISPCNVGVCQQSPSRKTPPSRRAADVLQESQQYIDQEMLPEGFPSPVSFSPPMNSPQIASHTSSGISGKAGDVFEQSPEFLVLEMPPSEFMPPDTPPTPSYWDRLATAGSSFTPDTTVDSFEEHEKEFMERGTPSTSPYRPCPSPKQIEAALLATRKAREQLKQLQEKTPPFEQRLLDKSLEDFESAERLIAEEFPVPEEKRYSPNKMERTEQMIADIPDPHMPRRKPMVSPKYAQVSPEWSPTLPNVSQFAEQIEEEFIPQGVWSYSSPKTPPSLVDAPKRSQSSPIRPSGPTTANIFDVEPADADFLDQILPPENLIKSPMSPPTPPRISDYYNVHTPPSPGSPSQLAQSVREHEFTEHYFDTGRKLMTDRIRVKNKLVPVGHSKRPKMSPVREAFMEDSPKRSAPIVHEEELVKLSPRLVKTETLVTEEILEPSMFPLLDKPVPQIGLGLGLADRGSDFISPPRTPRRSTPSKYSYVQSPPKWHKSLEQDIFQGGPVGAGLLETSPPGDYNFTSPHSYLSSDESPYYEFTSPVDSSPEQYVSVRRLPKTSPYHKGQRSPLSRSPIDSPSFRRAVQEHQFTDQFFHTDRPQATDMVKSGSKMVRLQRRSAPPPLDDIEEADDYSQSPRRPCPGPCSPNYDLPMPNYYGSPGRQFVRTPYSKQQTSPNRITEKTVTVIEDEPYDFIVSDRIPFAGATGPEIMDTSLIPEDLDMSFIEDDMADYKWMG